MRLISMCAVILIWILAPLHAFAAGKVALVIGNGAYQNATPLPNPPNDAADMAVKLEKMGFKVISGIDVNQATMVQKVGDLEEAARDADMTLFFYAGHGLQVNGLNYLVPVDAKLERPTSLQFETIETSLILNSMAGSGRTAIALLDACRDNPLSRSFTRSLGKTRSAAVGKGLAAPTIGAGGIIIGFSTAPGEVAADGEGRNSPFTKALLKNMETPGLEIQQLMTRVKADVYSDTKEVQEPWHNSSLRSEVYLVPPQANTQQSQPQSSTVESEWNAIKDSDNATALRAFMKKHSGDEFYTALADERLHRIEGNGGPQVAVNEEPPPVAEPEGDQVSAEEGSIDLFMAQALDIANDTDSGLGKPLPGLNLAKPDNAPGSKTPKLNLKRSVTATSYSGLRNKVSDLPADFEDFTICRSDFLGDGCSFMSRDFSSALHSALTKRSPDKDKTPVFNVVQIAGSKDVLFTSRPKAGDGEVTMAIGIVSPDMAVKRKFLIDISRARFGIDAGDKETRFEIQGARIDKGDLYLTLDSGLRCKGKKPIPRNVGLLLRASLEDLSIKWISPFNVSNVNIATDGISIYTATVGTCAASFIYSLDAETGKVNSRLKLPNGADKLMLEGDRLIVPHYPAASIYTFE
jgi:hypothetical protein